MPAKIRNALALYSRRREVENVEIRQHRTRLYNSIYHSDDQLLVNQHVFGIPAAHSPAFTSRKAADSPMANTYLEAFERVWADAV